MELTHVRVLVADIEAAKASYAAVLGPPGADHGNYVEWEVGGAHLALFPRELQREVVGLGDADTALIVLVVDDVDSEVERLGDRIVAGPVDRSDWGGRVAYLRDVDGNLIELFENIPWER